MDAFALELLLLTAALGLSWCVSPWRMLQRGPDLSLGTPLFVLLALLPLGWAVTSALPFAFPLSGASLAVLVLGWPLAVPALTLVGVALWMGSGLGFGEVLAITVWQGVVPASLALVIGAGVRRAFGTHPAVYVMGRAYAGTLVCSFGSALLAQAVHGPAGLVTPETELAAAWVVAVGEAGVTGAIATLLVLGRPQWLATWSERARAKPLAGPRPHQP